MSWGGVNIAPGGCCWCVGLAVGGRPHLCCRQGRCWAGQLIKLKNFFGIIFLCVMIIHGFALLVTRAGTMNGFKSDASWKPGRAGGRAGAVYVGRHKFERVACFRFSCAVTVSEITSSSK